MSEAYEREQYVPLFLNDQLWLYRSSVTNERAQTEQRSPQLPVQQSISPKIGHDRYPW